jgi:hypothetical protein
VATRFGLIILDISVFAVHNLNMDFDLVMPRRRNGGGGGDMHANIMFLVNISIMRKF